MRTTKWFGFWTNTRNTITQTDSLRAEDRYVEAGTKVLAGQTNGAFSVSLMRTGYYPVEAGVIENIAAKVAFSTDGKIYAGKDKAIELMPYEANTWYSVKIMLNLKEKTYDVEINGELKATGVPMNNPQVEEVNQIVFRYHPRNAGYACDNRDLLF